MGYHIEHILNKLDVYNLCIFDPHKDSFYAALHTIDWIPILQKLTQTGRMIKLFIGVEPKDAMADMKLLSDKIGLFNLVYTFIYRHFSSKKEEEFIELYRKEFHLAASGTGFFDDESLYFLAEFLVRNADDGLHDVHGPWLYEGLEAQHALLDRLGSLLRAQGMTSALGPISLSIWDEPGLEIKGFDEPPTAMMPHHRPAYEGWVEAAGYAKAKDLLTYEVDIANWQDDKIDRLIAAGERNPRIRIRKIDKSRFAEEARLILGWAAAGAFVLALVRLAIDVRLDPLDFDGLRTSFPSLTLQGRLQTVEVGDAVGFVQRPRVEDAQRPVVAEGRAQARGEGVEGVHGVDLFVLARHDYRGVVPAAVGGHRVPRPAPGR